MNGNVVNQGVVALPALPPTQGQSTTGMSQIQQGSLSAGASNPISSASLTPATPLAIPTVPFDTTANAVTGQAQASINQTTNMLNQAQADKQNAVDSSKNDLTNLQNEILGVQGQRAGLDKQAGLDTLNISIADLTNTLESSQKAQGEELKALSGSGLTDVQKVQQGREINRRYAIEQSDTLFALNQTQRRFDAASANIDRKIQLQLEPLQTKLKFSELFYQDNKTALTKAEDRAFQNLIDTNNKAYSEALANKTAIGDIQKMALANGINIPLSVLAKLNTATDANEAYSILQQNGISLENPLDREAKLANIEQSRASTAQSRASIENINADSAKKRAEAAALIAPPTEETKQKTADQLSFLRRTASDALAKSTASGRSGARRMIEGVTVGATDYTELVSLTNTLKTNVLSLMTDPNIKKFFGPQMSNADVLLMTSAGTTLNPEANTPEMMKKEIKRLDNLFNRAQTAVSSGLSQSQNLLTAPSGEVIQIID